MGPSRRRHVVAVRHDGGRSRSTEARETGKQPNKLGFDSQYLKCTNEIVVPSGAMTVRHMVVRKPSRSIWFGSDANTIGRVILP